MHDKIPYSCLYRLPDDEHLVVRNMFKKYNLIKSSIQKVCILLVLLSYEYHEARFRKRKDTVFLNVFLTISSTTALMLRFSVF
jgi:hypothetical protein